MQQITIPMFPLNMVILPGETKTLHIFEERYKELIKDCLLNEANFGILYKNKKIFCDKGVEVKINNVIKTYKNNEMDISIEGVRVFNLLEYSEVLPPKLYGAGVINYEEDIKDIPSHHLQEITKEYLWALQQQVISIDAFEHSNIYSVARLLELSSSEKHEFICLKSALLKENYLKQKIKLFNYLVTVENALKTKFVLN